MSATDALTHARQEQAVTAIPEFGHGICTGRESSTVMYSIYCTVILVSCRMHAQVFWIPQLNRKHSFLRAQQARHNRLGSTALPMQFPTDFKSGLICTRCPHIHPCPHPRSGMSHCGLVTVERSQSPMRGVAEGWAGAETLTDAPGLDRQ